uniref:Uncharacterized protein n=1 Tax=Oryza punctata TaxID=4537 RepID=A0A0E0MJA9_ORYPU
MELGELALSEDSTTMDNNVDLAPKHQRSTANKTRIIHFRENAHLNLDEGFTTEDYPRPHPNHPNVALSSKEFTTEDYPRPHPNHP